MRFAIVAALAASVTTAAAQAKGFNYGSTLASGAGKSVADFQNEFTTAQNLVGGPGFSSARLYTMVQGGTQNAPISAIQAAINTNTRLLLGLWASAGQDAFNNELAALAAAISKYGSAFANLVDGISIGSEDLYRSSAIGVANNAGVGATPDTLVTYIGEVRNVIANTVLAGKPVTHVDTWQVLIDPANAAVVQAIDVIGMDAYPYFESTNGNSIENAKSLFFSALGKVQALGKKVLVTETGYPTSGPVSGQAVASVANAKTYWDQVGCALFGSVDTYWYTLYDGNPSPSFGIVGSDLSTTPLFDLTCPAAASSSVVTSTQQQSQAAASSIATSTLQKDQATTLATVVKPTTTAVAPTTPIAAGTSNAAAGTSAIVATTAAAPVSQISDGQVQAGTQTQAVATPKTTPVSQTSAGQVQACVKTQTIVVTATAAAPVSQISDGQVQAGTQTQAVATPKTTGASTPAQPTGKSCPAALTGTYEYPHLIVPVDKNAPTVASGTSYNGTFNNHVSTVFNFDLPASYAGKTCSLVFLFPTQDQLTTSSFTFAGQGGLDVYALSSPVTEATSYSTVPSGTKLASIPDVKPGNSYTVASQACAAGQRVSYEFEATGSLALNYFQDYNPSPIGAYITVC